MWFGILRFVLLQDAPQILQKDIIIIIIIIKSLCRPLLFPPLQTPTRLVLFQDHVEKLASVVFKRRKKEVFLLFFCGNKTQGWLIFASSDWLRQFRDQTIRVAAWAGCWSHVSWSVGPWSCWSLSCASWSWVSQSKWLRSCVCRLCVCLNKLDPDLAGHGHLCLDYVCLDHVCNLLKCILIICVLSWSRV